MSSGFITEKEVEEKKRLRQLEWEKVRKPEDPTEVPLAPEELPDRRSLYERLQDQKNKKQEEFEEAHKLKNLVKVLDDDEADFLEYVDKTKMEEERAKRKEEAKELNEFRSKVAEQREKDIELLIKQEIGLIKADKKPSLVDEGSIGVKKTSQSKLLAGLVKRKSDSGGGGGSAPQKRTRTTEGDTAASKSNSSVETVNESSDSSSAGAATAPETVSKATEESTASIPSVPYKGNLVCIGVLPGLESYTNSSSDSDNESSSDSEESKSSPLRDLCGRKIQIQDHHDSSESKSSSSKEKK